MLDRILVTGPHRSGTTIATHILASELGLKPIIEQQIATLRFKGDDEPILTADHVREFAKANNHFVLQGATTFQWLPKMAQYFDLIVFMIRDIDSIMNSQMRYRGRVLDSPIDKLRKIQNMNLPSVWYLHYDHLKGHSMFYQDRRGWNPRQISP